VRVLIACEFSGTVREAFKARGHDAWSCDLLPTDRPGQHIQADVLTVLDRDWDLMIAHPPCTYLASSGLHWNKRIPDRAVKTALAVLFVHALLAAPVPRIAVENPIGCLSTRVREPNQIIQPHQFGDDASKATCLWLVNLPRLMPTGAVAPRIVEGKKRWGNQTDSGQNRLGPSEDRWKLRSVTYAGIAAAMAEQWGDFK
jgi:hypothetical protein